MRHVERLKEINFCRCSLMVSKFRTPCCEARIEDQLAQARHESVVIDERGGRRIPKDKKKNVKSTISL